MQENAGDVWDMGSIRGLGRSPGEGNRNPLQCSCLENSMDRGAWWATVHGVAKESDMTERLKNKREEEGKKKKKGQSMNSFSIASITYYHKFSNLK